MVLEKAQIYLVSEMEPDFVKSLFLVPFPTAQQAFDAAMAFRNEIYEQEMRTYRGMLKGIQEMQEGKLHDAQDVMDELRALRGWE